MKAFLENLQKVYGDDCNPIYKFSKFSENFECIIEEMKTMDLLNEKQLRIMNKNIKVKTNQIAEIYKRHLKERETLGIGD